MSNQNYSEIRERKANAGGGPPPPTGRKGKKSPSVKIKSASWGTGPTKTVGWGSDTARVQTYVKSKGV